MGKSLADHMSLIRIGQVAFAIRGGRSNAKTWFASDKSLDVRTPRPMTHRLSLDIRKLGKPFECLSLFCINYCIFIGIS